MRSSGQGYAEYGLILSGVALLAIVAVFLLGPKIEELKNNARITPVPNVIVVTATPEKQCCFVTPTPTRGRY